MDYKKQSEILENYWRNKFLFSSSFSHKDYKDFYNYQDAYKSLEDNKIFLYYYLISYNSNYLINFQKSNFYNDLMENIYLIDQLNKNLYNKVINENDLDNYFFSFLFQRYLLDSVYENLNINSYADFFDQYEQFNCNRYYSILKYNFKEKPNLINIHVYIEKALLKLVSSYKVKEYDITLNLYLIIQNKINNNIFLEKYSYRLNYIFQYMVMNNLKDFDFLIKRKYKINSFKFKKLNGGEIKFGEKILDFYYLI